MPPSNLIRRAIGAAAILNLIVIVAACAASFSHPRMLDFAVFWTAGELANSGQAMEAWVANIPHYPPMAYPPPFLLLMQPFALLSLEAALCLWLAFTFALFALAARGVSRLSSPTLLAFPPTLINGIIGQTGFLTAALFIGGANWLGTRPVLSGAMFGAMSIKPQLGLLVPFALLAGKEWRALAGAAGTVIALAALSALAYGPNAFVAWANVMHAPVAVMNEGGAGWEKMVSVFALLRMHGVSSMSAAAVHGALALFALAAVMRTWVSNPDPMARCAMLACGTALASPYLYFYDLPFLILPVAWCYRHSGRPWLVMGVTVTLAPAALLNWMPSVIPNPAPLVSLTLLLLCWRTSEAAIRPEPLSVRQSA